MLKLKWFTFLCILFISVSCLAHSEDCTTQVTEDYQKKGGSPYKRYLSAVAIFRDEADYLKEWIEYHRLMGVEYFYLYNNLSKDHYQEVLKEYISKKIVKLIEWPYEHSNVDSWDRIQCASYKDAVKRSQKNTKWLVILDTDEFFVPIQHDSIVDTLKSLEHKDPHRKYGAYEFNWIVFGTSGIDRVPQDRLMVELLTKNGGAHPLYKSIVRPKYVGSKINPHYVTLTDHKKTMRCPLDLLQINHYMYRDIYFMKNVKIPRRIKIGTDADTVLYWESFCNQETIFSDQIFRFIPKLKQRMGLDQ